MGLTNSPDIFQSVMHPLFQDIPAAECFVDDIGVFITGSLDNHLDTLSQDLFRLEESGFIVNPLKYTWTVTQTGYLGFLLTTSGIKPLPHKIEAISRISRPSSTTHVCTFVGFINSYKDIWPRMAHNLAPLTELYITRKKISLDRYS